MGPRRELVPIVSLTYQVPLRKTPMPLRPEPAQSATTTITVTVSGSCANSQLTNANTPPTFGQATYTLSATCRVSNVFVGMTSV